jgi:hypothetical protein
VITSISQKYLHLKSEKAGTNSEEWRKINYFVQSRAVVFITFIYLGRIILGLSHTLFFWSDNTMFDFVLFGIEWFIIIDHFNYCICCYCGQLNGEKIKLTYDSTSLSVSMHGITRLLWMLSGSAVMYIIILKHLF